jgi:hypothetical protein
MMEMPLFKQLMKITESHGYRISWKDKEGKVQVKYPVTHPELMKIEKDLEKSGATDIQSETINYGGDR